MEPTNEEKKPLQSNMDSDPNRRVRPSDRGPGDPRKWPPLKTWLWFAAILLMNYLLASILFSGTGGAVSIP